MNTDEPKHILNDELINEKIIEEMLYYLYSKGIVMKSKDFSGVIHTPICIFPSPTIKQFFNKIDFYQIAFNKLIDRMSRDVEFLKNVLSK
jgi:hypothetical protein